MTKSWGVKCCRPNDKFLDDPPDSDCQEPAPLPEAVGELTVNMYQPKLAGIVGASCGSELRKQRSITRCFFTSSDSVTACKSETQTTTASGTTKTECVAASAATKVAQHLRFILQELGFPQEGLMEIHIDDQAALQIINDKQAPTI